ncbi:hypothetical protein PI125_g5934 [Phytophthora idaei]|nr:hypothetical protein PI125_g5934 [Phytophthora idaei]
MRRVGPTPSGDELLADMKLHESKASVPSVTSSRRIRSFSTPSRR